MSRTRLAVVALVCAVAAAAAWVAYELVWRSSALSPTWQERHAAACNLAADLERAQAAYLPGKEKEYYESVERAAWKCHFYYCDNLDWHNKVHMHDVTFTTGEVSGGEGNTPDESWFLWDKYLFEMLPAWCGDVPYAKSTAAWEIAQGGSFGLAGEQEHITVAFLERALRDKWTVENDNDFEEFAQSMLYWQDGRSYDLLCDNWPGWTTDTQAMIASQFAICFTTPSTGAARLATIMAQSGDPRLRRFAARVVPAMVVECPEMEPIFRKLLGDSERSISRAAAYAAGISARQPEALLPAMRDFASGSPDAEIEREFLTGLAYAHYSAAVDKYAGIFLDSTDETLKGAAAVALFAKETNQLHAEGSLKDQDPTDWRRKALPYARSGLLDPRLQKAVEHDEVAEHIAESTAEAVPTKNEPKVMNYVQIEPEAISPGKMGRLIRRLRDMDYVDPIYIDGWTNPEGTLELLDLDFEVIQSCQSHLKALGVDVYADQGRPEAAPR